MIRIKRLETAGHVATLTRPFVRELPLPKQRGAMPEHDICMIRYDNSNNAKKFTGYLQTELNADGIIVGSGPILALLAPFETTDISPCFASAFQSRLRYTLS
ncbi:hypothetical protein JL101_013150 [Skermanella rosea]|uniref:hypothetical protein n=1 Tax=Skermanella rosea TaxID=1817965 RepID=UPI001933C6B4|nr:hypothetical protein [Skermanella rosea]UEM06334.1 hypothetical protein JL101_013150 [Skermanella rosea]